MGLADSRDLCLAVIARCLVEQTRFDPLHDGKTEQALRNQRLGDVPGSSSVRSVHHVQRCCQDVGAPGPKRGAWQPATPAPWRRLDGVCWRPRSIDCQTQNRRVLPSSIAADLSLQT